AGSLQAAGRSSHASSCRSARPRLARAHMERHWSLARGDERLGAEAMARKTSFYYSFLVLPRDQRKAIVAVWDFCRVVDDAVDENEGLPGSQSPREAIAFWRAELARAYDGQTPLTPEARALQAHIRQFELPRQAFDDVIDGVAMDLETTRYP